MSTPILATKLFIPPPRPNVVPRDRLIERLNQGLHTRLTLISAPAGFGKTTLVSSWISHLGAATPDGGPDPPAEKSIHNRVAWLSLDEGDNDLTRFLAYVVAALQTIAPELGRGVLAALHSPQRPPVEPLLTALLNEIASSPQDFVLVLDDYHVIDAEPSGRSPLGAVDHALRFLIDHLPPQMRLVIATREDPPLPLARLRAQGQLTEVRAADLRFTPAEATAFLNHAMGLSLTADAVAALEERTEGWIAGLQLAALSMQGHQDREGFIQAFTGSHRFVLDYLVEEVLQRQSDPVRSFLLQTAILRRLSGPLCSAVTGQRDGDATLARLERGNLFIAPLDDQRHWYRYHHLFADVLLARLKAEQPDLAAALHQRASAWHEKQGLLAEAIHHALAGEDFTRAAEQIELAARAMLISRQDITLLGWLKALPDALVRTRPVLSVYYALALVSIEPRAAEDRLRDAERLLDLGAPSANVAVADKEALASVPGIIAIVRAYLAGATGDAQRSAHFAQQAWERLPEHDHLWRGAAAALVGLAQWTSGDLEEAYHSFSDGVARLRMTGDIIQSTSGAFILASIRMAQGRLQTATRIFEQALALAISEGDPAPPPTADLYVGLSETLYERGELEAAHQALLKSKQVEYQGWISDNRHRWPMAMARLKAAEGDPEGALGLLDEAERLYLPSPDPNVRPVAALKARVWLKQGRLAEAMQWAHARGLSASDELSYLREFEHITLARVLIAQFQQTGQASAIEQAHGLLARLLRAAEAGGRAGSVIEIRLLQALAQQAQGNVTGALASLALALALAEPEGYVRLFVDEGPPMAQLLSTAAAQGIMPGYLGTLLAAFSATPHDREAGIQAAPSTVHGPSSLIEPLSERELEVLTLIAEGLSNQEISERLFLALSTVKGHNRNLFGKLQVQRRTEAVARARALGLV
ncbi:MAG: tetratricopeptide repeat protein [Caldilineaceae bacterium]|nr:tetratricopeptide repeat protein [Caldilineaceae bacterium]